MPGLRSHSTFSAGTAIGAGWIIRTLIASLSTSGNSSRYRPVVSALSPGCKESHPLLGGDFPPGFDLVLSSTHVSAAEFRHVLSCTTEVLYSTMFGAADEEGSRWYLSELVSVAESVGVEWPDMTSFCESKWSDCHGWGKRPTEQELAEWRRAGRG